MKDIGAGERSRTSDLRITSALLYQLSYSGKGREYKAFNFREPINAPRNL
jgi:hypothetical protein